MRVTGIAVFESAIGACGIAWGDRGIVGVHLPAESEAATRRRLRQRFPDSAEIEPPTQIREAISGIVSLLRGEPTDLTRVGLDMARVSPFDRDVYVAAREIPPGATRTYGEIARRIGQPAMARDVGVALARNPFAIVVPCHRVVAANGKMGGFSAAEGVKTKLRLLAIEGCIGDAPLFQQQHSRPTETHLSTGLEV